MKNFKFVSLGLVFCVTSITSAQTLCSALRREEIRKLFVFNSQGESTPSETQLSDFDATVTSVDQLPATLLNVKTDATIKRVEVILGDGNHFLQKRLKLTPAHSFECGLLVKAQSHGMATLKPEGQLKNWVPYERDIVQTQVPPGIRVTGLSLSGKLLLRSRYPKSDTNSPVGTMKEADPKQEAFILNQHRSTELLENAFANRKAEDEGDPQIWIPGTGSIYIFEIENVKKNGSLTVAKIGNDQISRIALRCMQASAQNKLSREDLKLCRDDKAGSSDIRKMSWRPIKHNHPFFLENHVEFISNDGEWAFDAKTRKLFLKKPSGMSLQELNTVGVNFINDAPRAIELQTLLSINGVEKLHLEGIRFEGAPFFHQEKFFVMARGAVSTGHIVWNQSLRHFEKANLPSAIEISNSNNATLYRNEFVALDSIGISLSRCSNLKIDSNLIRDTGYSALEISGLNSSGLLLSNNVMRDIGVRGVGDAIRVKSTIYSHIINNDIRDTYRGGIQFGAGECGDRWSASRGQCQVYISNNAIRNFVIGGLSDYGGIYVNSINFGKVSDKWSKDNSRFEITQNVVENGRLNPFYPKDFEIEGPTAIYLDIGSKKVLIERNTIENVDNAFNQNCSDANRWVNNRVTRVKFLLKSQKDYKKEKDWIEKCVELRKEWASIKKNSTVIKNNDASVQKVSGAGLSATEFQYWRSRGIGDLYR